MLESIDFPYGGFAVGGSDLANGEHHALGWDRSYGTALDLGTLGGGYSHAFSCSRLGTVGESETPSGERHATLFPWSGGSLVSPPIDLGTLGGGFSTARSISPQGDVVGWSTLATGEAHAFHIPISSSSNIGTMTDLGTLGGQNSWAHDVHNETIVGSSETASGAIHAFVWQGNVMTDLNDMLPPGSGWVLERATALDPEPGSGFTVLGTGWFRGAKRGFKAEGFALSVQQQGSVAEIKAFPLEDGTVAKCAISRSTGSTVLPGCGGLTLGLHRAYTFAASTARAGDASFDFFTPPGMAGTTVYLQAYAPNLCAVTEVEMIVLQ